MAEQQSMKKKILREFMLLMFVCFIAFLLSQTIGLAFSGFESAHVLQQFSFYVVGIVGAFIIAIGVVLQIIITKRDNIYGSSTLFNSPGETPSIPIPFFKRTFLLFLFFLIFFLILGVFFLRTQQTAFTGFIIPLEQQFTPTQSILFTATLIPGSENLMFAALLLIAFLVISFYARKYNWDKGVFIIITWFSLTILGTIYGIANHLLRYSGSDIDIFRVAGFWFLGSILTLSTGSFIPFWVAHIVNNLIFDLKEYLSSDIITIWVIGIIILLSVLFLYLVFKKPKEVELIT